MYEELQKFDIVLLVGNYGAGKSQIAKEYFEARKRVDRHELRHSLKEMTEHGKQWTPEDWNEDTEGLIKHMEHDIICHFLERNVKVIIDNTSLTKKSRKIYIEYAKRYSKSIACVFLQRDVKRLLEENRQKEYSVPDHVIVHLYAQTEVPSHEEGFDTIVFS